VSGDGIVFAIGEPFNGSGVRRKSGTVEEKSFCSISVQIPKTNDHDC
jgi:hypothetical protein